MSIWETLSSIDCSEHIEKKGQFSYLAWTWAWAIVKERYPDANYAILDDVTYSDGSMEVRCHVIIEGMLHAMWLPVLDFKNKPIQNPNAFDINSARMRCLVKCLAMFGLGHYIYAGESAPQERVPEVTPEHMAQFKTLLANNDHWGFMSFFDSLHEGQRDELFNSAPKGEKTKLKDECRALYKIASEARKHALGHISLALTEGKGDTLKEALDEMEPLERDLIMGALTELDKQRVDQLLEAA